MSFNLQQARADGAQDTAIAAHLAAKHGFNLNRAHADGVTDSEIAEFLAARPLPSRAAAPVPPSTDQPIVSQEKSLGRRALERVSDVGLDLSKGVVGAGEAVVGVADLLTGNAAGDALARVGYEPKRTKEIISSGYSDPRKAENARVQAADGFVDTAGALLENPATAVGVMAESAPLMLGSAAAVRSAATGLLARAGIAPGTAAAGEFLKRPEILARLATVGSATEGATAAGSIQEGARQEGRTWSEAAPYAVAGGVGTAAIGRLAAKVLPDADTAAGTIGLGAGQRITAVDAGKKIAKSVAQEGVLEELPQSAQEQVFSNLATDRPWAEGVPEAAAQGMIAGLGMGAGATTANVATQLRAPLEDATTGLDFTPESIEAAARAALNPALAQQEVILRQREADAAQRGDPLDLAVVQLENDVARATGQQEAAPIDQNALLDQARAAAPPEPSAAPIEPNTPTVDGATSAPVEAAKPASIDMTTGQTPPAIPRPVDAAPDQGPGTENRPLDEPLEGRTETLPPSAVVTVESLRDQLQRHRWAPTNGIFADQAPDTVATFPRKGGATVALRILQGRHPDADLAVEHRLTGWAVVDRSAAPRDADLEIDPSQGDVETRPVVPPATAGTGYGSTSTTPGAPLDPAPADLSSTIAPALRTDPPTVPQEAIPTTPENPPTAPEPTAVPEIPPAALPSLDHGALNIPGRTNGINAELDRHKRDQAKAAKAQTKDDTAQRKAAKAEAQALFTELWPAMRAKLGPKFGDKELHTHLDQLVKWEPSKFIALARQFQAEQSAAPVTTPAPVAAPLPATDLAPAATPSPAPSLRANGQPFASAKLAAASAKQRKLDMVPVEVPGGWGLAQREAAPSIEVAPAATPAPRKPAARRPDGRAAILAAIDRAKQQTGDPAAVAEYHDLVQRVNEARRIAALKKTPRVKARELMSWADNAEQILVRLRDRIGFVRFESGTSHYKVLNTPEHLDAFAKKVRSTAAFRTAPADWSTVYDHIETRPGTTDDQLQTGRHALRDLARRLSARNDPGRGLPEGRGAISVLGSGLFGGFTAAGGNRLVGQVVESPADLATLAQVYRDPRFETFRVFYTDDTGRIIGEAGYSNRLPAAVYLPNIVPDIQRDAAAYGAAGYFILHNHPSGRAMPSIPDLDMTRTIAAAVPGFRGHVVIDHNEFATIDANGSAQTITAPELNGVDFHAKPELEHALLGTKLGGPTDVATLGKALQIAGGHATLIFTRRAGEVQLIVDLPAALLTDDSTVGIAKLKGAARRAARAVGAGGSRFIVLPADGDAHALRHLLHQGVFTDVVQADGLSLRTAGVPFSGDFLDQNFKPAARVAEAEPYSYASEHEQTAEAHGGRPAWEQARAEGRTKLGYRQWVQVRTPAFINWFGDWQHDDDSSAADSGMADGPAGRPEQATTAAGTRDAGAGADSRGSRRVDRVALDPDTGEPRVFYHGTGDDVASFDFNHPRRKDAGWLGRGAYVSSDDFIAESYARTKHPGDAGPNILPVFVRAASAYPADLELKRKLSRVSQATVDEATRRMRAAGYDASALVFDDGTVELVTFDPASIKSAIGNTGTFDPLDADIVREDAPAYRARQTQTPEFKRWFGASKVVDAQGAPLVVYHGTAADLTFFDPLALGANTKAGSARRAFFFAASPKVASGYAMLSESRPSLGVAVLRNAAKSDTLPESLRRLITQKLAAPTEAEQAEAAEWSGYTGDALADPVKGANVLPLYLSLQNPLVVDYRGDEYREQSFGAVVAKAKAAGHDGVIFRNAEDSMHKDYAEISDIFAVFKPEQIKSATGNSGAFDPVERDIVREDAGDYGSQNEKRPDRSEAEPAWRTGSKVAGQGAEPNVPRVGQQGQPYNPARPALPEETLARRLQRRWQDKFNRFTVIQDWLKAQGVTLSEQADVFRAEERMHGRTATQIEDFRTLRVQPLIEDIRKAGFTMAEVADFLHAQHAEERNAQIAKLNSEMPDDGSGMTTAEAQAKLAQYRQRPELVRLANELRATTDDSRRLLLDAGILTQEMSDAWTAAYQHYIPLKGGPEEDAANQGTGRGLTVKQKVKRALGHGARDEWIIENILRDHERAILQVEKNRVGQHLLQLAIEAANEDLITIGQPARRKVLRDAKAYAVSYRGATVETFHNLADAQRYVGQEALKRGRSAKDFSIATSHDLDVVMMPSPVLDPSETQVYVAGHAVRVQFKDELLARAWNAQGAEHMNLIFRGARMINTWLSKAYTGYNVEFISTNIIRDFTTGVINLTGEEGAMFTARTIANYPKAMGELLRYAFTGNASNWIRQYRADGGSTGAAYLSDLERVGRDVQAAYDEYAGLLETARHGGPLRAARVAGRKTVGAFIGWVEKLNQAGENSMRLAAYRTAVEMGQTRAQAAALAKNSTVNFNRSGELGPMLGAAYLFANPAIQGSASITHALFKGKHKHQAQALTAGLVGLGSLMAMTRGGGDEDEYEKLGEFTKERHATIWTGTGWAKIPIAYGYGFFFTLGRKLHELQAGEDPAKIALHLASTFVSEFSVWGAAADADGDEKNVLFLLPTVAQIIASPIANRTGLGAPIYPESKFDESRPDNLKMWRATQGTVWHRSAETLNATTGGSAVEKGWLDVSPETMRYLWGTATGGTGRFFVDSAALVKNTVADGLPLADVESREVPIVRKFVQPAGDIRGTRARFWKYAEEATAAADAFHRAAKVEDHAQRHSLQSRIQHEQAELLGLGKAVDSYSKAISAQRDAIDAVRADESKSLAYRRNLIRTMERDEAKLYDDFVARFKQQDAKRQQRLAAGSR